MLCDRCKLAPDPFCLLRQTCVNCHNPTCTPLSWGNGFVCSNCAKEMELEVCEDCGEATHIDNLVGGKFCHNCAPRNGLYQCAECNDWVDHIDRGPDGNDYCYDCQTNLDLAHCEDCGELVDCANLVNGQYCDKCAHDHDWDCCNSCRNWVRDASVGADSECYCQTCWGDSFFCCYECEETFYIDDARQRYDSLVCEYCYDRLGGDNCFNAHTFRGGEVYSRMPSRRRFGVEVETDYCPDHINLEGGAWGAQEDGSISGMEMVSTILWGDEGLAEIDKLCDFAKKNNWGVDDRCGLHVHFDMRNENTDSLKAIGLAYYLTYEVWSSFVPSGRRSIFYCGPNRSKPDDLYGVVDFARFAYNQNRYEWVNFNAYHKHRTLEVRLHHGTLNGKDICNWIRAHAVFIDWAVATGWIGIRQKMLALDSIGILHFLQELWDNAGCSDLRGHFAEKVLTYGVSVLV